MSLFSTTLRARDRASVRLAWKVLDAHYVLNKLGEEEEKEGEEEEKRKGKGKKKKKKRGLNKSLIFS